MSLARRVAAAKVGDVTDEGARAVIEPDEVLRYWLDDVGPKGWYAADDAVDATIRDRFGDALALAADGGLRDWCDRARSSLAYIVLTDQFSRNVHRGEAAAFATDATARAAAQRAIHAGWDRRVDGPARMFFYMPLEHSESLEHQERAVRLFMLRMPQGGTDWLLHARAHREVIRLFGRFPFRNEALGRSSTPAERDWLDAGAYGATVKAMQAGG